MPDASEHSPVKEPGIADEDEIDQEAEDECDIGSMYSNIAEFVR